MRAENNELYKDKLKFWIRTEGEAYDFDQIFEKLMQLEEAAIRLKEKDKTSSE